jgi:hypothetical protein
MRNLSYLFLVIFFGMAAFSPLKGQICMPDTSLMSPGIYPDTLFPVCLGEPVNAVITVVVPVDTVINVPPFGLITVPIDSIQILGVIGLPPGVSFQCPSPGCSVPGGNSGCYVFSGIASLPGVYVIDIIAAGHSTLIGNPVIQIDTLNALYTITVRDTPSVSLVSSSNAGCGLTNGTATVSASGGTPPYSFSWSDGQNGATAMGLAAGFYFVDAVDMEGCTGRFSVSIQNAGAPSVALDPVSITMLDCFGGSNGLLELDISGGSPPFSYSWSTGATTAFLSGLSAGSYSVAVTDNNNCTSNFSATITEPAPVQGSVNVVSPVSCAGQMDATLLLNLSGGSPPFTVSWSNGQTGNTVTGVGAGLLSAYVLDANSCLDTFSLTVVEPTLLMATVDSISPVSCAGDADGAVILNVVGGSPPFSFAWSNGATSQNLSNVAANTYSVTVVDSRGCTDMDTATVDEPAVLDAMATATDETVSGASDGTAQVSASGGTPPFTYLWSTGSTLASLTNLDPGNYIATVTDANGCSASDTVTVNSGPLSIEDDLAAGISSLQVLPNPSNGRFRVSLELNDPEWVQLTLLDVQGRIIRSDSPEKGRQVIWDADFHDLTPGIYLLRISTPKGITGRKLCFHP